MTALAVLTGGLWVMGRWTECPAAQWILPGFFVGTLSVLAMAYRTAELVSGG